MDLGEIDRQLRTLDLKNNFFGQWGPLLTLFLNASFLAPAVFIAVDSWDNCCERPLAVWVMVLAVMWSVGMIFTTGKFLIAVFSERFLDNGEFVPKARRLLRIADGALIGLASAAGVWYIVGTVWVAQSSAHVCEYGEHGEYVSQCPALLWNLVLVLDILAYIVFCGLCATGLTFFCLNVCLGMSTFVIETAANQTREV